MPTHGKGLKRILGLQAERWKKKRKGKKDENPLKTAPSDGADSLKPSIT